MSDKPKGKNWIGAVFGLLFLLVGLTMAYGSGGKMIFDYLVSASWVKTPATIHHVELEEIQGSETTSYSVKGSYSYIFDGASFEGDRISVSLGSDSTGNYWQNLYEFLQASRGKNEVTVYVNANDPSHSVLDRTFRWAWLLFALLFLFVFSGLGVLFMWLSLRGKKHREVARESTSEDEKNHGIVCNEKPTSVLLAIFGSIFFFAGAIISLIAVPDALAKGEYAALISLLITFVGAAIMYHAYKIRSAFQKTGLTPLFLDPTSPGVGGQLGGIFEIDNKMVGQSLQSGTSLKALLTCRKKSSSGDNTRATIVWREESPVYFEQTAQGIKGQFVFDIPEDCRPTKDWEPRSIRSFRSFQTSIQWQVSIVGELNLAGLGKIDRSWNVRIADIPASTNNVLNIPEPFLEKAKEKVQMRAASSARDQIPITEDARYIEVLSNAGRHLGSSLSLFLFGLIFGITGGFLFLDGWWPGLLFSIVGAIVLVSSIFFFGKSVEVKFDKHTKILHSRQSWFGIEYSYQHGELLSANQFYVKKTASQTVRKKYTEFYALNFNSDDREIRVAERVTDKHAAQALKELILERCFSEQNEQAA